MVKARDAGDQCPERIWCWIKSGDRDEGSRGEVV